MARIKRSQTDGTVHRYKNNNKRFKLHDSSSIIISESAILPSLFEHLPNEIIYDIFTYLEITHTYDAFFDLNTRFQNLLLYSNLLIQVNISTMSKSTFERYHKNIITRNQHRINYLRLSNPFIVDIIFSPAIIIASFVQLEKLVLDHIHASYLRNILKHAGFLCKLHSLIISLVEPLADLTKLWTPIFRLRHLNYCKITYEIKSKENPPSMILFETPRSPIEHLVLNTPFPYNSLDYLLYHLPELRHLSINSLITQRYIHDFSQLSLTHLQYVSLKLDGIHFDRLEPLITNYFRHVEVLCLTTRYDQNYLDADRWERLITASMPDLRRFDLHHNGGVRNNSSLYHQLIDRFSSPFWTGRGWHFVHQHTWLKVPSDGIFYSTNPYR